MRDGCFHTRPCSSIKDVGTAVTDCSQVIQSQGRILAITARQNQAVSAKTVCSFLTLFGDPQLRGGVNCFHSTELRARDRVKVHLSPVGDLDQQKLAEQLRLVAKKGKSWSVCLREPVGVTQTHPRPSGTAEEGNEQSVQVCSQSRRVTQSLCPLLSRQQSILEAQVSLLTIPASAQPSLSSFNF